MDTAEKESKLLKDYKADMEALLLDKRARVEELRLIQSDIVSLFITDCFKFVFKQFDLFSAECSND